MKKEIIFHLGFHKTGTTSIQNWLDEHFDVLKKQFYIYNLADTSSGPLKLSANQFDIHGFNDNTLDRFNKVCKSMNRQISSFKQETIIYTDEQLLGLPLGFTSDNFTQEETYPNAVKIFELLCDNFKDHKLSFIIYVREHSSWLQSIWNQMKKQKSTTLNFQEFSLKTIKAQTLQKIALDIQEASKQHSNSNVIILNFESDFSKDKVWDMNFFKSIDLNEDIKDKCKPSLKKLNQSVSQKS